MGIRGQGGPPNLFKPKILFFCHLKPHAKFHNPSGRKVTQAEREKERREEEKTPLITVDT